MLSGNGNDQHLHGGKDIKEMLCSPLDRLLMLQEEVAILKTRIQPHDTGHIHTTISVLEERIAELRDEINAEIHAQKN